jgi:diguanylate cyclase (GGDEF)-like protein
LQVTSLCQAVLLGAQGAAPVLVEYRASEIPDGAGHVITCRDITENRALARQLVHQANHDGLTGLFNRYAFSRSLRNVLDEVAEQGAKRALLYIDLDQFKLVNDTAGHVAGDALLRQVAERFGSVLAENDLLARLGGDEFAAILFDCDAERAMAVANALIASVREYSFQWERRQFRVGASIGVVPLAADCVDPVAVLTQADVACYTAKDSGRNRAHLYRVDDGQLSWHHSELHRAAELETMLVSGGFSLNAQPIVRLSDGSISHYELLLRVHGAEGGATSPGAFISAAERFGMMSAIDRWVFNQAVRVCTSQAKSKMTPLCINISGSTISDPESANYIVVRLRDARLPAGRICFEITETAVVSDPEAAARFIAEVKTLGCTIALDDFGSGLASFASLKSLPVDLLKIDGSLVRRVSTDAADRAMVAAIHEMARALSLLTVAEWVEDGRTATMLRDMGIEYGQGFALGRGQPLHEMFKDQKLYAP